MLFQELPKYEGSQPFLYACYCAEDEVLVFPILARMYNEGFRQWASCRGKGKPDFRALQRLSAASSIIMFMSGTALSLIREGDPELISCAKSPCLRAVVHLDNAEPGDIYALSAPERIPYKPGNEAPFWLSIYSLTPLERCRGPWPSEKLLLRDPEFDDISQETLREEYQTIRGLMNVGTPGRMTEKFELPGDNPKTPHPDDEPYAPPPPPSPELLEIFNEIDNQLLVANPLPTPPAASIPPGIFVDSTPPPLSKENTKIDKVNIPSSRHSNGNIIADAARKTHMSKPIPKADGVVIPSPDAPQPFWAEPEKAVPDNSAIGILPGANSNPSPLPRHIPVLPEDLITAPVNHPHRVHRVKSVSIVPVNVKIDSRGKREAHAAVHHSTDANQDGMPTSYSIPSHPRITYHWQGRSARATEPGALSEPDSEPAIDELPVSRQRISWRDARAARRAAKAEKKAAKAESATQSIPEPIASASVSMANHNISAAPVHSEPARNVMKNEDFYPPGSNSVVSNSINMPSAGNIPEQPDTPRKKKQPHTTISKKIPHRKQPEAAETVDPDFEEGIVSQTAPQPEPPPIPFKRRKKKIKGLEDAIDNFAAAEDKAPLGL